MILKGSEYMSKFLLSKTLNTRDLGGYSVGSGKITNYNMFIRSDVPLQISNDDIELLLEKNITTILDLRSDDEVQIKPCAFKDNKNFQYHHCKIHGDGNLPKGVEFVPVSYFEMVDEQKTILNIMRVLSKVKGGSLYHCTAGKDRTGVISALLLLLAGVSKSDILDDYETSEVYLSSMLQQFCKINKNIDINIITPKREYMDKFLDMFQEKYNSVEEYFYQIGLSHTEIIALKNKLIDCVIS